MTASGIRAANRDATLWMLNALAYRLAAFLDADRIVAIASAIATIAGRTDLDFPDRWFTTAAERADMARGLLLDQLVADGLPPEAIDPIRDEVYRKPADPKQGRLWP